MKETMINVETGAETSRNLSAEEVAQINVWIKIEEQVEDKENKRFSAKNSLIEKLGLTADEAKLLIP
jgi:hypothetical protein